MSEAMVATTCRIVCGGAVMCLLLAAPVAAQDLDPRAYVHVPVDGTFVSSGAAVSHGSVVSDPTAPVTDITATVATASLGLARSFALFGQTAQVFGSLPVSWADVSGRVLEAQRSAYRAGLADMRVRVSLLVRGAPASNVLQLAKAPRRRILGTSVTIAAPTGEYFPDKLINLGTNRWSVKPEFAVSQPFRDRWLLDVYAGVWLFTENDAFYPGTSFKAQAPVVAFQSHLSYNVRPALWAALDLTFYAGGATTVDGVDNDDGQANSRIGGTLVVPVGRRHSLRFAVSTGAIVRQGANFTTLSVGWQAGWAPRPTPAP
jgi:hypothetical protein